MKKTKIGCNGILWNIDNVIEEAEKLGMELVMTQEPGDCEILWGEYSISQIEEASDLKWFQCAWAGVDGLIGAAPFAQGKVILTNSSGAYDVAIAEYLLGGCLALLRRFPAYDKARAEHRWSEYIPGDTLCGKKVTVLGMGHIGSTFAKLAEDLGAVITGVRRSNLGNLPKLLPETEILVMLLPATRETRNMIGEKELAMLPDGAYVLNAGRGATLDIRALEAGLMSGQLAGAVLDVYPEEPVDADDPLWDMPNLIMTPHIAGASEDPFNARLINRIFIRNLRNWKEGRPLENVIDYQKFC